MTRADLPMLAGWLEAERVRRWFDEPNYIEDLEAHLDEERVRQWIVATDGAPVAYLQDYRVHAWETHPLGFLPEGAKGLDTFIGAEALMGQGLAPRYLALHAATLFAAGVPAIGIDPHPDNRAAIRAYEKAGFRYRETVASEWGDLYLMVLWPQCSAPDIRYPAIAPCALPHTRQIRGVAQRDKDEAAAAAGAFVVRAAR